jgi:iron complex outermembrane receptor protein
MQRTTVYHLTMLIMLAATSYLAQAQPGTLGGTIHEAGGSNPIVGATIKAISITDTTRISGGYSKVRGSFTIRNLQPGTYRVSITAVGFSRIDYDNVAIASNHETPLNVEMQPKSITGDVVVVTASRKREKVTEAPASISVVSRRDIEEQPSLSITDHIRALPGVAYAQTSVEQQSVEVHGANSVFSGSLLVLSDNRMTNVPSLGINYYALFPPIDDDIEQIELVRGPASALYGGGATVGVMNVITRSPFASQGTSVSLSGGSLSTYTGSFRHAGTIGERFGYKISGRYLHSNDFVFLDTVEVNSRAAFLSDTNNRAVNPDTL